MSNIYQYPLKIDKQVIDNIRTFAKADGRSLNKEIEFILNQYRRKRVFGDADTLGVRNRIVDISDKK